jgi:hypothetical protein
MHQTRLRVTVLLPALLAAWAHAGQFTFSYHDASGSGSANVFDGGPVVFDEGRTLTSTSTLMEYGAVDRTGVGTLAAFAEGFGESRAVSLEDELRIFIEADA